MWPDRMKQHMKSNREQREWTNGGFDSIKETSRGTKSRNVEYGDDCTF